MQIISIISSFVQHSAQNISFYSFCETESVFRLIIALVEAAESYTLVNGRSYSKVWLPSITFYHNN